MPNTARHSDTHWGYVAYFAAIHLVGIYGIWYACNYAALSIVLCAVVYYFLGHLAITCGAHRLYSHESYEATQLLQYIWVLLFSATAQAPITLWAGWHKRHHSEEDKDGDPHSPLHGWFHSHMGWLIKKRGVAPPPAQYMRHFHKDRGIRFAPALWQAKNYYALMILMAYGVPALIGTLLGDWLGGLLVIGSARLMFQYHLTWIVNSYGHIRGEKIENGLSATATNNNGLLAILTVGELLHANHHERPRSYRFGTRSRDMDIGWWVIEACMLVGLARPLEKRSH